MSEENKDLQEENAHLNQVAVNLMKSRDAAVKEADGLRWLVRRMLPSVKFQRAAVGNYATLDALTKEASEVVYGEGQVCDDHDLGLGALRQTVDKMVALCKSVRGGRTMDNGAFVAELSGYIDRLDMVESMLMGDGSWRNDTGIPVVREWLAREKKVKEAANVQA